MLKSDRFAAPGIFAVLLAVALLLALLATACGGGGDKGETPSAGETPAVVDTPRADGGDEAEGEGGAAEDENGAGDDIGADGGGAGEDEGGDGDGAAADGGAGDPGISVDDGGDGDGANDEALQELKALAGKAAEGVTAKVTYRVTTDLDGGTFEGEWVLVQRPPDSRFEISGMEEAEEFRTIIINAGDKSYICFSGFGEGACLTTEAETGPLHPLFDIPKELAEEAADVDIIDTSQRRIAGVDATCFVVKSDIAGLGEGEICFSDEGVLLHLQGEADGASTILEAASVSTDVTNADFEPPYEVIELPGFGAPEG